MPYIDSSLIMQLKDNIEGLNKFHQIQILKIFNNEEPSIINENNNGIFINLVDISKNLYDKLYEYILYVNVQQKQLISIEDEKIDIENKFFKDKNKLCKENKDNVITNNSDNIALNANN